MDKVEGALGRVHLIDRKTSSNAVQSLGAISIEEKGVWGGGWGGSKVRKKGNKRVSRLERGGDPVQVVQVKVEAQGPLFDLKEVSPVVTPTQIIPFGEVGFNSKVGSNREFINGDS